MKDLPNIPILLSGLCGYEDGEILIRKAILALAVREDKKASTSYLQRRLRIGYNCALAILKYLESLYLVGPEDPINGRQIVGNLEDYL